MLGTNNWATTNILFYSTWFSTLKPSNASYSIANLMSKCLNCQLRIFEETYRLLKMKNSWLEVSNKFNCSKCLIILKPQTPISSTLPSLLIWFLVERVSTKNQQLNSNGVVINKNHSLTNRELMDFYCFLLILSTSISISRLLSEPLTIVQFRLLCYWLIQTKLWPTKDYWSN